MRAQFSTDFQTNIVSGVSSNWIGNGTYVVGSNTVFDQLQIVNGGSLSNGFGYIGYEPLASNNSAVVSGPGSVWNNTGTLAVGFNSGANQLTIANGGVVRNTYGILGNNASSSNNAAWVTGTGSVWSNGYNLIIGGQGAGNQLTISDGGLVVDSYGHVGDIAGSNVVLVTDAGSVWSNGRALYIGYSTDSRGNHLIVTNGGLVYTAGLLVGQDGSGTLTITGGTVNVTSNSMLYGLQLLNGAVEFTSGTLNSGRTFFYSNRLVVGNGLDAATYHLLGGTHSPGNGLILKPHASLTGCGTVNCNMNGGVLIDTGAVVQCDCGGLLTFTDGTVTNYGTLRVINGGTLEMYVTLLNFGTIDFINGFTNFHNAFINHGTLLDARSVAISQIAPSGLDYVVQIPSVFGHRYQLQSADTPASLTWTNSGAWQSGTGGMLTFTDIDGAANVPSRFYRVLVTAP